MKRGVIVVVAVLLVGAAVAAAWRWSRATSTTTVMPTDAAQVAGVEDDPPDVERGDRPPAGTYEYVGTGRDHFSALGGAGHEFPKRIAAVVELDPDDACVWTMHVVFVAEHVEERRLCSEGGAVRERGFERRTEFLGRENVSRYACSAAAWRIHRSPRKGETWRWTCRERRGGLVSYEATYIGDETMRLDGGRERVRHVVVVGMQDDDSVGRERSEYWLLDDGLPARLASRRRLEVRTPLGAMTTTERWDYVLASRGG